MQELTCERCGEEWQREPKRGRKPRLCPMCQEGGIAPESAPEPAPEPQQQPKPKRKRKSKWEKLEEQRDKTKPDVGDLPFTSRTSGWCTDYDPAPEAQHDKCDGDLGKYRCPCECHGWPDGQAA